MTFKKILVGTATVLALGTAVTACSTDDQSENSADSQAVNAEQGAFPTTIEHRYGSTEIKEVPQRVVSLGYTDQDALLALSTLR